MTVGTEQMGVTDTNGIVNVEITLNTTGHKLQQIQTSTDIKPTTSHVWTDVKDTE